MAEVGGDVAGDDWDDCGVGSLVPEFYLKGKGDSFRAELLGSPTHAQKRA